MDERDRIGHKIRDDIIETKLGAFYGQTGRRPLRISDWGLTTPRQPYYTVYTADGE